MSDGPWKADGEVQPEQVESTGTMGDDARGVGYSVRFVRDDLPGSMVTVTCAPGQIDAPISGTGYVITGQIEYLICDDPADPGGTEVWSDYEYDNDSPFLYRRLTEAEQAAKSYINRWLANVNDFLTWDGQARER